jgi:predicted  nucleic acid-binding Zn-ribbon protein
MSIVRQGLPSAATPSRLSCSETRGTNPHPQRKTTELPIESKILETEREVLKNQLREIEGEQRKLEAELKLVRQRELRTKREIEALSTLLDIATDSPS